MENAGNRVVDFLRETFAPLSEQRVVVVCGKGNNGGDGFVVARMLKEKNWQVTLAIVGNADPSEKMAPKLASERAVNEKAYLVGEKGLDASRISVYTGTAGTKTAATTIIPAGATLDTTGLTPVDETAVKAIPRTAPVHHKKK